MKEKESYCSFCGRPKEKVRELIVGPNGICICDECVESCREQILDARARTKTGANVKLLKPAEIKARLDDYIIGQDRAKRVCPSPCITIISASTPRPTIRTAWSWKRATCSF